MNDIKRKIERVLKYKSICEGIDKTEEVYREGVNFDISLPLGSADMHTKGVYTSGDALVSILDRFNWLNYLNTHVECSQARVRIYYNSKDYDNRFKVDIDIIPEYIDEISVGFKNGLDGTLVTGVCNISSNDISDLCEYNPIFRFDKLVGVSPGSLGVPYDVQTNVRISRMMLYCLSETVDFLGYGRKFRSGADIERLWEMLKYKGELKSVKESIERVLWTIILNLNSLEVAYKEGRICDFDYFAACGAIYHTDYLGHILKFLIPFYNDDVIVNDTITSLVTNAINKAALIGKNI